MVDIELPIKVLLTWGEGLGRNTGMNSILGNKSHFWATFFDCHPSSTLWCFLWSAGANRSCPSAQRNKFGRFWFWFSWLTTLVVDLICSEDRGTMYQRFRGLGVSLPFLEGQLNLLYQSNLAVSDGFWRKDKGFLVFDLLRIGGCGFARRYDFGGSIETLGKEEMQLSQGVIDPHPKEED